MKKISKITIIIDIVFFFLIPIFSNSLNFTTPNNYLDLGEYGFIDTSFSKTDILLFIPVDTPQQCFDICDSKEQCDIMNLFLYEGDVLTCWLITLLDDANYLTQVLTAPIGTCKQYGCIFDEIFVKKPQCKSINAAVPNTYCQNYCIYDINGLCNDVQPHMSQVCECNAIYNEQAHCFSKSASVPDSYCQSYCHIVDKKCVVDQSMTSQCECKTNIVPFSIPNNYFDYGPWGHWNRTYFRDILYVTLSPADCFKKCDELPNCNVAEIYKYNNTLILPQTCSLYELTNGGTYQQAFQIGASCEGVFGYCDYDELFIKVPECKSKNPSFTDAQCQSSCIFDENGLCSGIQSSQQNNCECTILNSHPVTCSSKSASVSNDYCLTYCHFKFNKCYVDQHMTDVCQCK